MAKIDIDKSLSAKITQVRNPKSFGGAKIVDGEFDKVLLELRQMHFLPDEIRDAIDRAGEEGLLNKDEVDTFEKKIEQRLGKSMAAPAGTTNVASDTRYGKILKEVTDALTKKGQPHLGFAQPGPKTAFNPTFWKRIHQPQDPDLAPGTRTSKMPGTFEPQTRPSAAVLDILKNPQQYAYDCATAAIAVTYIVLGKMLDAAVFDDKFQDLCIGPWVFDKQLQLILEKKGSDDMNQKGKETDLRAGDIVYFNNPAVDDEHKDVWGGENATFLGEGKYYAHGLDEVKEAKEILAQLTKACGVVDTTLPGLAPYLVSKHWRPNTSKLGLPSP